MLFELELVLQVGEKSAERTEGFSARIAASRFAGVADRFTRVASRNAGFTSRCAGGTLGLCARVAVVQQGQASEHARLDISGNRKNSNSGQHRH